MPGAAGEGSSQPNFLLEAYWTCKDLETQSRMKTMEKATRILGFGFDFLSPTDAATGNSTGRTKASPLSITKFVDQSTPLEIDFLVRNKVIKETKIAYFSVNTSHNSGAVGRVKQMEITLVNARVVSVSPQAVANASGVTETISMTYDKITILDVPSTKQTDYEWTEAIQ